MDSSSLVSVTFSSRMGLLSPAASPARIALTSWLNATSEMNISRFWCTATLSNRAWMWIDLASDHSKLALQAGPGLGLGHRIRPPG